MPPINQELQPSLEFSLGKSLRAPVLGGLFFKGQSFIEKGKNSVEVLCKCENDIGIKSMFKCKSNLCRFENIAPSTLVINLKNLVFIRMMGWVIFIWMQMIFITIYNGKKLFALQFVLFFVF